MSDPTEPPNNSSTKRQYLPEVPEDPAGLLTPLFIEFLNDFTRAPQHLEQEVTERLRTIAAEYFSDTQWIEKVVTHETKVFLANFIHSLAIRYIRETFKANHDWLYHGGSPSEEGLAIEAFLRHAHQLGIKRLDSRWDYATSLLENQLLRQTNDYLKKNAAPPQTQAPQTPPDQTASATPAPDREQPQPARSFSALTEEEKQRLYKALGWDLPPSPPTSPPSPN